MSNMRERYQRELRNEKQRLQQQILTLSEIQQKQVVYDAYHMHFIKLQLICHYPNQAKSQLPQQRVHELEQELANITAECCNLQGI